MRKYWIVVFVVCLAFLLVACNPEGEAPLPTLIPTLAEQPTTQPPTVALPTDTPVPDSSPTQQISNELPPTWTPTFTACPRNFRCRPQQKRPLQTLNCRRPATLLAQTFRVHSARFHSVLRLLSPGFLPTTHSITAYG